MKVSVSLASDDVSFLDSYATAHGIASRSAAVASAVQALRESELRDEYERAYAEWDDADDASLWDRTTTDDV